MGDQLTGTSSADVYRRQLLEVLLPPEILAHPRRSLDTPSAAPGARVCFRIVLRLTVCGRAHPSGSDTSKLTVGMADADSQW
eukprot:4111258-Prymnesium_polylepis.1